MNPFDVLDNDAEDPSQLIEAKKQGPPAAPAAATAPKKGPAQAQGTAASPGQPTKLANLPSKPLPPAEAGEFFVL